MNWNIKDAVIPSKLENLLYAILAVVISVIGNLAFLATLLANESLYIAESFSEALALYVQETIGFIDNLTIAPVGSVFLFWSLAGIISFSLLQSFISVAKEIKNDVDISTHYLHPKHYIKPLFFLEVVLQGLAHGLIYLLILGIGILVGGVFAPIAIILFQGVLLTFTFELFAIYIGSLVVLWFGIVVMASVTRLLLMRKQIVI